MSEIIHLSFGPQANYLHAEFFNHQSDYFVYTKEDVAKSVVDPKPRFVGGNEYTPRAVFFDFKNAYSSHLRRNEKYEIQTNEFETKTDEKIQLESVKSWTANLQGPVHPESLQTIPDWEFDYERFPNGRLRGGLPDQDGSFDTLDEGITELDTCAKNEHLGVYDYIEEKFRPQFERCDLLQGVDLVTDLAGWGGFSSGMLETLRDDLVGKKQIFSWMLSRNDHKKRDLKSRLEILTTHCEFSDLVVPISNPFNDLQENAFKIEPYFETVCLMSALRNQRDRIPMYDFAKMLNTTGNIVDIGFTISELNVPINNLFNRVVINRNLKGEDLFCPQPGSINRVRLQVTDQPLNLRKFQFGDHEFKEKIFDLTEPYLNY